MLRVVETLIPSFRTSTPVRRQGTYKGGTCKKTGEVHGNQLLPTSLNLAAIHDGRGLEEYSGHRLRSGMSNEVPDPTQRRALKELGRGLATLRPKRRY